MTLPPLEAKGYAASLVNNLTIKLAFCLCKDHFEIFKMYGFRHSTKETLLSVVFKKSIFICLIQF